MSLRGRLLGGVLALVALGLVVSSVATYSALQSFLLRRTDQQLEAAAAPVVRSMFQRDPRFPGLQASDTVIPDGTYGEFRDGQGRVVNTLEVRFRNPGTPPPDLPEQLDTSRRREFTVRATVGSLRYRVLTQPTDIGTLVVALPLTEVKATLTRLVWVEVVVSAAVLALVGGLAAWVVRVGLRPLDAIGSTAGAIAAGDLSRRVEPATERTEVGRLGLALNAMLGQIEGAFAQRAASEARLRQFVSDASHELRTPLTSIRGYAELFRRGAAERPEDLAVAMRRIEEEAERMGVLVDDLLLLARLDQGRPLERAPVDLSALAVDAVADARAASPDHPVELDAPAPVTVVGDEGRLRQVLANLLGNARVHTPPGTRVAVRVGTDDGMAVVEVADDGPGLDGVDAARLFERFYRADSARWRATGGSGLGLSIVDAIVRAHAGTVRAGERPGGGARFRVKLPRS